MIAQILALLSTTSLVTMVTSSPHQITLSSRHKRSVLQLCEVIEVYTNRQCLDYNDYGCYCGLGNAASLAVDTVDECCRSHDNCYDQTKCSQMTWLFDDYSNTCDQNNCTCQETPETSSCAYKTCLCDVAFGQCLSNTIYNNEYSNYNRARCPRSLNPGDTGNNTQEG